MTARPLTFAIAVFLCTGLGACSTPSGSTIAREATQTPSSPGMPRSYTYVLTSSCGERPLIGRYRVTVEDGVVRTAEPLGQDTPRPDLAHVPTLAGLLAMVDQAEPGAVVELSTDDAGLPVSVSIDHVPDAIDDEECYEVDDLVPID